jgi:diadenosine tetraphosphate (Ap4A) HIT family hydrolase
MPDLEGANGSDGCRVDPDGCPLCDAVARPLGSELDSPIACSDGFALIPALGQVAPGHALITSRSHRPSLLAAPVEERLDAEQIVQSALERVHDELGLECAVFEHGYDKARRRQIADNDCSINHLHIHVVPLGESTLDEVQRHVAQYEVVGASTSSLKPRDDYLLYRRHHQPWLMSPPDELIRSRHFLKIIDALEDMADSWDEALGVNTSRVEQTRDLYAGLAVYAHRS